MVFFNNDRVDFPFYDDISEKEKLKTQILRSIQGLSEEDLYYYLAILELTLRTED